MQFNQNAPVKWLPPLSQYAELVPLVVVELDATNEIVFISDRLFDVDETFWLGQQSSQLFSSAPSPGQGNQIAPQPVDLNLPVSISLEAVSLYTGIDSDPERIILHLIFPDTQFNSANSSVVYNPSNTNKFALFAFVNFVNATVEEQQNAIEEVQETLADSGGPAILARIQQLEDDLTQRIVNLESGLQANTDADNAPVDDVEIGDSRVDDILDDFFEDDD